MNTLLQELHNHLISIHDEYYKLLVWIILILFLFLYYKLLQIFG
jgi:hypothetical protein